MRISPLVAGTLCCLMGGIWFLQGINVLPGSFMTGQMKWAIYGGLLLLVGVGLLVVAKRRRP
jgi:LPXTG-motif cell wall-anchored protein